MLHIEHINLVVSDVPAMLAFYQTAFPNWKIRDSGEGDWHGKSRTWLHFGDDFSYIALSDNGEGSNRDLAGHQVGLAHFSYVTSNVDRIVERLVDAGYEVSNPGAHGPFRKNVYFIDPAGFEVEFVEYLSDDPAERNH